MKWKGGFNSPLKSIVLIIFELIIVLAGVFIIRKKKQAVIKILISCVSIVVFFAVLEIFLSLNVFSGLKSDSPKFIPAKYWEIGKEIAKARHLRTKNNEFGFNDSNHTKDKTDKTSFRIAVLGDSFIWGEGVADSVIWTHKLEKRFQDNGINCEILNWGLDGWSTLDEYKFLTNHGLEYQFDYLIFAFVINDPVMDSTFFKDFIDQWGFFNQSILTPISKIFPNDVTFCRNRLNGVAAKYLNFGYTKWLNNLYTADNLAEYSDLLKKIKQLCESRNIKYSFVITPENHNVLLKKYIDKITPILERDSVKYLDLFPYVMGELGNYPNRALWGTPADSHPGNLVTDLYAKHIYNYLVDRVSRMPFK